MGILLFFPSPSCSLLAEVYTSLVWCRQTFFQASSFISSLGQEQKLLFNSQMTRVALKCVTWCWRVIKGIDQCAVAHLQSLIWCLGPPQQEQTHHRWIRPRVALSQPTLLPSSSATAGRLSGSWIAFCWAGSVMAPSFSSRVAELATNPGPHLDL